ncbi:MAG: M23 family metallopeptidase [Chloroflexota bacterium]
MTYLEQSPQPLRSLSFREIPPVVDYGPPVEEVDWHVPVSDQMVYEKAVPQYDERAGGVEQQVIIWGSVFIAFILILINGSVNGFETSRPQSPTQVQATAVPPSLPEPIFDPTVVVSPYDTYWLTQGLHGQSYGHLAIDIAAGKNSPVYSPIHGEVTAIYTDQYGNPTLVIENDRYAITMLHGLYEVVKGQQVEAGQYVGREGNLGYTTDMNGVLCTGRENCGYHTHLNIFDKRIQTNIDPRTVLP